MNDHARQRLADATEELTPAMAKALWTAYDHFTKHPGQSITVKELANLAEVGLDSARRALEGLDSKEAIERMPARGRHPDKYWF